MKIAEDFRRIAREVLKGKWLIAVVVGLAASLLGGVASQGPQFNFNINASDVSAESGRNIISSATSGIFNADIIRLIAGLAGIFLIIAIVIGVVYFLLGSFVGVGYAKFNLNLVDRKEPAFETLFEYFSHWKVTAVTKLLRGVYVFLWSLLFVVPGIVAGFSYAMTEYILAENPELTATQAIEKSKSMMYGNRWRLFCLQFSFIGWDLLAALTFGIGNLWLTPYKQAAVAAFYREVSGTEFYSAENEYIPEDK